MLDDVKYFYKLLPYIFPVWIMLNIFGNTIKMTFHIDSKYIIWILLFISIAIFFIFFNISFQSLFVALVTFSFSVSSYDLVKYYKEIRNKKR